MRVPLAVSLESRDGTVTKGAKVTNGLIEGVEANSTVLKRFGSSTIGASGKVGTAQWLGVFNGKLQMILNSGWHIYGHITAGALVVDGTNGALVGWTGTFFHDVYTSAAAPYCLVKSISNWATDSHAAIIDNTNVPAVIAGANYQGSASSQIVHGTACLDGYFFIMDTQGNIYGSTAGSPVFPSALNVIQANTFPGAGVFIGRTQNYIVAFKEQSTEFFYDAGNPVGSPLSAMPQNASRVGCASAYSVANLGNDVFWMAQEGSKGRSVYQMNGTQQVKVSTEDVERVLNADDLATVYSYCIESEGHRLYLLTLVTSNITLVYDAVNKIWGTWSSNTLGSSIGGSITITRSGTTATWTSSNAHGLIDGDPVLISGCTQTDYNGVFQISYVSATSFNFEVANSPATPATGSPVGKPYTETYFKYTKYASYSSYDVFLHESDGALYIANSSLYQDNGLPINFTLRSQRLDGGTNESKKGQSLTLIGDKVSDTIMVRWADDDYTTPTTYRRVTLSLQKPQLRRNGSFRRRSYELRHVGNTKPRLNEIELEITQ